jgi:hypothetical protein
MKGMYRRAAMTESGKLRYIVAPMSGEQPDEHLIASSSSPVYPGIAQSTTTAAAAR